MKTRFYRCPCQYEFTSYVRRHLPNVKPDRVAAASTSTGLPGSRARAEESTDIVVTISMLLLTERAVGPGAMPDPAYCLGFSLFRANFATYSLIIAYLCVHYASMEAFHK